MDNAYFSNIRNEIILALRNAEESIFVAMAWFTNRQIFEILLDCCKKGIKVKVIIIDDVINHAEFGNDFNELIKIGGEVYLFNPELKLMHNKFCIIDNCKIITGSYNWTNYAETRNYENISVSDDIVIAKKYLNYYNDLLSQALECTDFKSTNIGDIEKNDFIRFYKDIKVEIESLPLNLGRANYEEKFNKKIKNIPVTQNFIHDNPFIGIKEVAKIKYVENRQCPVSKYNLGFKAYLKDKEEIGLKILIPKGTLLPYTISKDAWTNEDNKEEISCEFFYGISENINECKEFSQLKLNKLPKLDAGKVKFKTNITFDTNGYIRVEFICLNTGNGEEATCLNPEFVEYKISRYE